MLAIVLVQKLGLEPGHIDIGRALALARLAFETEVEHLVHVGIGESLKAELAGDRQPKQVGAAPGAIFLVAGCLERGAHRPFALLAAGTDTCAQFGGRQQAAIGAEVERRLHGRRDIAGSIAQVRRQRRRIDDLAGVEQVVGVNRLLQLSERLVEHASIHLLLKRAAHQAVAVLARKSTAVLEHQLGDLFGDGRELAHALLGLEVDHRPDVQAADRRVGIDAGLGLMPGDQRQELGDVIAQMLRRDGRVFNKRDGLGVSFLGHGKAQRHRAQLPDSRLRGRVGDGQVMVAETSLAELVFERGEARR